MYVIPTPPSQKRAKTGLKIAGIEANKTLAAARTEAAVINVSFFMKRDPYTPIESHILSKVPRMLSKETYIGFASGCVN